VPASPVRLISRRRSSSRCRNRMKESVPQPLLLKGELDAVEPYPFAGAADDEVGWSASPYGLLPGRFAGPTREVGCEAIEVVALHHLFGSALLEASYGLRVLDTDDREGFPALVGAVH